MAGSDAAGRLLAGGLSDLGAGLGQGLIGRRARRDERDQLTTEAETLRSLLPQEQGPSIDDFLESPAKQRKKLTDTLKGALPDDDLASMSLGDLKGTVQSLRTQLEFGGEMMRQQQEQQRKNAELALLGEMLPEGQFKTLASQMAAIGGTSDSFGDLVGTVLDPMQDNRLAEMDLGFRQDNADRNYAMDYLKTMERSASNRQADKLAMREFDADEEQRQFENTLAREELELKRRAAEVSTGAGKDLTESQAKSVASIGQAINAFNQLGELDQEGIDRLGAGRLVGFGNPKYNQASRQMAMGLLRDESGAVISDSEIKNKIRNLFPNPRDGEEVREQKRMARISEIGTRQLKIPERMRADLPVRLRRDDAAAWERLPNGVVVETTDETGAEIRVRKTERGPELIE